MGINVSSYINVKTGIIRKDDACYATFNNCTNFETFNILIEKEKRFYPLEEIYEYFQYLKKAGVKIGDYFEDENNCIQVNIPTNLKIERIIASTTIRYLWENKYENKYGDNTSKDKYYKIYEHFMNLCRYFPEKDFFKLLLFATNLFATGGKYVDTTHCIIGSARGTKIMSYDNLAKQFSINDILYLEMHGYFEDMKIRDEYTTKEDYQRALDVYDEKLISSIESQKL
jgi:hypothetical protein